jgi:lipoprotein-anchoring transpeptidase ErfK/SrfK
VTSHHLRARRRLGRIIVTLLVLCGATAGLVALSHGHGVRPRLAPASPVPVGQPADDIEAATPLAADATAPSTPSQTHAAAAKPSVCRSNGAGRHVFVSIRQQHVWMCAGSQQIYATAATTGASANGDGTPTGTWHVLAKETDRWLTPLDGGSYHVAYWVPYDGPYGFHDSSWQKFAYGSEKYRTDGSHGCVHLPMSAMKWFYKWAQVGTAVTIAV